MRQRRNVVMSLLLEKAMGFFDSTNPINGLNWFTRSCKHVESPVYMYIEAKLIPICSKNTPERKNTGSACTNCSFCYLHVRCYLCLMYLVVLINGLVFFYVANLYRQKYREKIKDSPMLFLASHFF